MAPRLHQRNAFQRFERAQQDAGPDAGRLTRYVAHERCAVGQIDIGVTTFEKQDPAARCEPAEGVAGRVPGRIGLGFHKPSRGDAVGMLTDQDFADQVARERHSADRQFGTVEAAGRLQRRRLRHPSFRHD
jgi:hypothetical protein